MADPPGRDVFRDAVQASMKPTARRQICIMYSRIDVRALDRHGRSRLVGVSLYDPRQRRHRFHRIRSALYPLLQYRVLLAQSLIYFPPFPRPSTDRPVRTYIPPGWLISDLG